VPEQGFSAEAEIESYRFSDRTSWKGAIAFYCPLPIKPMVLLIIIAAAWIVFAVLMGDYVRR
jgi:hypothetical protein